MEKQQEFEFLLLAFPHRLSTTLSSQLRRPPRFFSWSYSVTKDSTKLSLSTLTKVEKHKIAV